jgi:SpoVK/Ycf46/Vps4 family AAA+-type ATPase
MKTTDKQHKGVLTYRALPDAALNDEWDKIILHADVKDRLLGQAVFEFTVRGKVPRVSVPLHGIILLVGPPGTGKTSLARGLANRVASSFKSGGRKFHLLEVEPHALASAALGRSQQAVRDLLQETIREHAAHGPLVVLLDEVETLVPSRHRMSLEANPVDVHRATDAALAGLDLLAAEHDDLLFIATSNFEAALDEAFISRVDLVERIGLPDQGACLEILRDTLLGLAGQWKTIKTIADDARLGNVAAGCVGLDGRQIRKAVIRACTLSKETALDPNRLKIEDLLRAVKEGREK